jgi:hypothetical protein
LNKFASLQTYKINNLDNYKLIIKILQVYKLQECICKFVQVCKFKKSRNCKLQIYNFTNWKRAFASMQNCHITKLPNMKLHSYKLYVLICKFQIYKLKKIKLQIHVCKYTKLPLPNQQNHQNYKVRNCNAFLCIYKFAHVKFASFHTCMYYKIIKL